LAIDASIKGGAERAHRRRAAGAGAARHPALGEAWFETARNFVLYANEGGLYDELLAHLRKLGLA
jgi:hypothetical protein